MPRLPRRQSNSIFFHVMSQGINKNYIFDNKSDILYYINAISYISSFYPIRIIAYCIMNNHVHMLIHANNITLISTFMQRLNTKYAQYYNYKYKRVGYVFRNRFQSQDILTEHHLYNCINYIHNNPVKAKICNAPSDYPYSSYKKSYTPIDYLNLCEVAIDFNSILNSNKAEITHFNDNEFIDFEDCPCVPCKVLIDSFFNQYDLNLSSVLDNKYNLQKLILFLKNEHSISLREISSELSIGREKIRRLYNEGLSS